MCQCTYDITYEDFNPTVYYLGKHKTKGNQSLHSHDYAEILYILSGRGWYQIGGQEYEVSAGDVILCNPGTRHRFSERENSMLEFYLAFNDFQFRGAPPNHFLLADGSCVLHTTTETRQEMTKCCYEMIQENDSCRPGKYFMLKACLIKLLILLVRETGAFSAGPDGCCLESYNKGYAVKKIISYLTENYEHKISLDQIARNMYLSPVYISKIFKEETGESPINYLIKIRLEKAKEILTNEENLSIKEVAGRVGYEDVYHFSKLFKKYYGIAPLYYRKSVTAHGLKNA